MEFCTLSWGTVAHGPQGWLESRLEDREFQVLDWKPSPVDLPRVSLELSQQYWVVHSVGLIIIIITIIIIIIIIITIFIQGAHFTKSDIQ